MESPDKKKAVSLDDFTLLTVLGKGTYAKVVLVKKKDNDKIYAMKIIKKSRISKPKHEEHIYTERNILIDMKHPFIIKMDYSFQNDKKLFFVLEYCIGGELFYLLQKKRRLKEEQVKFYIAQVILAIEHLHSWDVIYRDLKPENVLLDDQGYIRITDFGLSKTGIQGNKEAHSFCGTPEYLAPEIILKKGHGKAADWWTLASFTFELLTGRPPISGDKKDVIYEKIKKVDIKYTNDIPPLAREFLEAIFIKEPSKRLGGGPGGAQELKAHPWLSSINWQALLGKEIKAPFIPKVKTNDDISNFDRVEILLFRNSLRFPLTHTKDPFINLLI